jgi:hypothetical protein
MLENNLGSEAVCWQTPENVLNVAIVVSERRLRELDDMIDDPKAFTTPIVSKAEWDVLASLDEMTEKEYAEKKRAEYQKDLGLIY